VHVVLSLVGIASGVLVLLRPSASPKVWGLTRCSSRPRSPQRHGPALSSAVPALRQGHGIAIASLMVFVPTLLRCGATAWPVHGGRSMSPAPATLLYLNAFIAVMQAFGKVGYLRALPPTTLVSPLVLAHLLVLATRCGSHPRVHRSSVRGVPRRNRLTAAARRGPLELREHARPAIASNPRRPAARQRACRLPL
jgi:hypothetical protein